MELQPNHFLPSLSPYSLVLVDQVFPSLVPGEIHPIFRQGAEKEKISKEIAPGNSSESLQKIRDS